MKRMLLAATALFATLAGASAQAPYKIHTTPKLPARDSLERMNLTLAWNTRVSVDGNRDGIFSVQIIPGKPSQLVVQTYKGGVYLYDADSGDLVWKNTVGVAYSTPQAAGFNSQNIFVTRLNILYVLNRADGAQRVYQYDPRSKLFTYGYALAFTPNAGPSADEDFLYVPMGNRVHAILVPDFEKFDRDKKARAARKAAAFEAKKEGANVDRFAIDEDEATSLDSPQPDQYWGYSLANQLTMSPPLISGEQLGIVSTEGFLTSINRHERGGRIENFEFKTTGRIPAAAGQHLHVAFLASDDYNLYAVNLKSGNLIWRYVSGAPLRQQPYVNDRDVYIAPERVGLRRIDRVTGREVWTNRDASRFLAANLQNVYALDGVGKFFVLDALRGTTLAKLDLADWTIAVSNEWTDRVFLAANDGQLICLRHRELAKSLHLKVQHVAPPPKVKKEEKPMEEKKMDDDKDKEKAAKIGRALDQARQLQVSACFHVAHPGAVWDDRNLRAGR